MDSFLFRKDNGEYIGVRGLAPKEEETDIVGLPATQENIGKINEYIFPKLSDGQIVEAATPEQIAEAQIQITNPISRMRFWLNVWRVLRLTEDNIIDQINQLPDSDEKIELLIKVKSATEFDRYDPSLIYMAGQMGITDDVLNQIFT
jgi:hypothetical protein